MFHTRHRLRVPQVLGLWLLVLSIVFGPVGLGGSLAFALTNAAQACGTSCPCASTPDDGGESAHAHDGEDAPGHDATTKIERPCEDDDVPSAGDDPCEDDCPDDCPECNCGVAVAVAVLPLPLPARGRPPTSAQTFSPPDSPLSGAGFGIFKPPRG